jgi:hypothetical protein
LSTDTEVQDPQVKSHTKTFFSHSKNLILIRVKPVEQVLQNGKTIVTNKTDYEKFQVQFANGFFLAAPGDLVCPNPDTQEMEDVVTFLENHPRFGREFFLQEESAPDATEVLAEMARLIAAQNMEGLAALYQREEENWGRPQVLEPIRAAADQFEQAAG